MPDLLSRSRSSVVIAGLDPAIHDRPDDAMANYFVYLLASRKNGTLYVGVTNDLARRVYEHREGLIEGFSKRYAVKRLVYYELHEDVRNAIQREKNIKKWPRAWKMELIERDNPDWNDLYETLAQ